MFFWSKLTRNGKSRFTVPWLNTLVALGMYCCVTQYMISQLLPPRKHKYLVWLFGYCLCVIVNRIFSVVNIRVSKSVRFRRVNLRFRIHFLVLVLNFFYIWEKQPEKDQISEHVKKANGVTPVMY